MDKPYEPSKPFPGQFRKYDAEYRFDRDQDLDSSIIEELYQASLAGKSIFISTGRDRGYDRNGDDDTFYTEITISTEDPEAYQKALIDYQNKLNSYKTNLILWNEYQKFEQDKKEREAKAKRYAQFLELQNEFKGQ